MASEETVTKVTNQPQVPGVELVLQVRVYRLSSGALGCSLKLLNEEAAARFGPEAGLPEVSHSLLQLAVQCETKLQLLKLLEDGQTLDAARVASSVRRQLDVAVEMILPKVVEHCTLEMGRIQEVSKDEAPST